MILPFTRAGASQSVNLGKELFSNVNLYAAGGYFGQYKKMQKIF